nr:glycosyltransferase family 39 protein [uncultured Desulfobacter sp.]
MIKFFEKYIKHPLIPILLFGLLLRVISWYNTCIINSDAIVYIAQAKALFYNSREHVLSGLPYLSIYSLLVAWCYPIFKNWIVCATSISLFFGTVFLIPLYLFVKDVLDRRVALIVALIYATIPVFVSRSVDIFKDPLYWFFLTVGLFLFSRQLSTRNYLYGMFSLFLLAIAAMVRVEAVLFSVVCLLFLIFISGKLKVKLVFIGLPLSVFLLLAIFDASLGYVSFRHIFRLDEIASSITGCYLTYSDIREQVKVIASRHSVGFTQNFLLHARRATWLIAFETFINGFLEGVAYMSGLFIFTGFIPLFRKFREPKLLFCFSLLVSSVGFLYLWAMMSWTLSYRYIALFTIPAAVSMGLGLNWLSNRVAEKCHITPGKAMAVFVCMTLSITIVKDLKPRRHEFCLYKKLGQQIALREGNDAPIIFATNRMNDPKSFLVFYANVNYKGYHPVVERGSCRIIEMSKYKKYQEFISRLKTINVDYYLMTIPKIKPFKSNEVKLLKNNETIASWPEADGSVTYLIKLLPVES